MNQISAADNTIILTTPTRWRLLHNERPTAEATPNGFRYGTRFGSSRKLPQGDTLERRQIRQVVLGWQPTDEAWHLGLILSSELAAPRQSRWCELVHWPDPDSTVFQELAEYAGQELAQVMRVPFRLIPPQFSDKAAPSRPLPELPLEVGIWRMEAASSDGSRFVFKRAARWRWRKYSRIAWYFLWMIVYLVVSLATLFSEIALPSAGTLLPNPQLLPYLGLGAAALLLGLIVYHLVEIVRTPNTVLVDGRSGSISAWKDRRLRWQVPAVEVQSLYVSEIAKKREQPPATEYGELNLHMGSGNFRFVLSQEEAIDGGKVVPPEALPPRTKSDIRPLERSTAHTDLQVAALYVSECLNRVPVWHDLRVK